MSRLEVSRTGGFAGIRVSGSVAVPDVDSLRDRLMELPPRTPHPDRFVYELTLGEQRVKVGEKDLTDDLRDLVVRALGT